MLLQEPLVETTEYRLALVLPHSGKVLALIDIDGTYSLPAIRVPQWERPAEQLQKAIRLAWKLHILVLEFLGSTEGYPACVIAEVLASNDVADLKAVGVRQLSSAALGEQQRVQLESMLAGGSGVDGSWSQLGRIDEAITWLESESGKRLSSKREIEQYNAGGGFALVRFRMEDGAHYWLKATGVPNAHELPVTTVLSALCGDCLPEIVAARPSWNAWLMSESARPVAKLPTHPMELFTLLNDAARCMADLQTKTRSRSCELLGAGAFDQRIQVFQKHTAVLFDYIEEAMSRQTSTRVPPLEKARVREIRAIFESICQHLEALGICDTVVHGDLNHGNILTAAGQCQFIDWSEAYIGNPLISLQHLLLLNNAENLAIRHFINSVLQERYLNTWGERGDADALREAFIYVPMLAIASTLYGRGDWLSSPRRDDPNRLSYARSLARHLDRAAHEAQLLGALCH
jgi:thiamine kinase-like enzyme